MTTLHLNYYNPVIIATRDRHVFMELYTFSHQLEGRRRIEIKPRDFPAHQAVEARRADHGGVVRAKHGRRHHQAQTRLLAFVVHGVAQARVAGYAAGESHNLRAGFLRRKHGLVA